MTSGPFLEVSALVDAGAFLGAYILKGPALAVDTVHRKLIPIATLPVATSSPKGRR